MVKKKPAIQPTNKEVRDIAYMKKNTLDIITDLNNESEEFKKII